MAGSEEKAVRCRAGFFSTLIIILVIALTVEPNAKADQARGRILAEQQCSHCHIVRTKGLLPDPEAPSFAEVAAEPSSTEYTLRVFLKTPHPTMPNLIIKPNDLDDLVSYFNSLKPNHWRIEMSGVVRL